MPKVKKLLFSADILVPYEKLCNQFKLFQNWMIFRGGQNAFSFPFFEKKSCATKIYSTKKHIYNQQEIVWKGFQDDQIKSTN